MLAALVADPEQMRFYPHPRSRAEARAWIELNLAVYAEHGFGTWLIEDRETAEFLGYSGMRPLLLEGAEETEIGWNVAKTAWNRGIATEAALAARELAFTRFGLARLVALLPPGHEASRRVAEKIGMRDEGSTAVFDGARFAVYAVEA